MNYLEVPTYKENKWSYTNFATKKDWIDFLRLQFKDVGTYDLTDTKLWQEKGQNYFQNKSYSEFPKNSKGYHDFWLKEGIKCHKGIIWHSINKRGKEVVHYVTGYYYFYLNYCPITVKHENNKERLPEIWDLDYHTFLYLERSFAEGKYAACNKRRQTGWSYKMAAIAMCDLWFKKKQKIKVFSKGSKYVNDYFTMCSVFRNHLITNTGWNRQFWKDGAKDLEWHMIWKAQEAGRDIQIGRDNWLKGINTATNSTNLVGGYNTLVVSEESGVDSDFLKNIGYVDASLKQGDIVTGKFIAGGSVGELKDCEGLRKITYKPEDYGFLSIPDLENPIKKRVLFIPVQWNYIHPITDPNDESVIIGQIKCYDENGNSDVEKALKLIASTRERKRKQDPASFTLYCSQNPITLDELYQARETNIFDTALISKQRLWLDDNYEDVTVELVEEDNKIVHKYINKHVVSDFPLKHNSEREGCIVMFEPPIKNPKPYMYFAGVDPVQLIEGKGESLFSIHIFLNYYEENNVLKGGYPVAWYTGRYFDDNDTFEIGRRLIKYYNALTTCESDVDSFINYMKSFNEEYYLLKRSQIPIMKDLVPNSSISGDEYGIRMNTGGSSSRVRKHILTKIKEYTEEKLDKFMNEKGEEVIRYGVERIKDRMFLKELEEFDETNITKFDRNTSFGLALMTAKCYESNRVMQKIYTNTVQTNDVKINKIVKSYTQFSKSKLTLSKNRF